MEVNPVVVLIFIGSLFVLGLAVFLLIRSKHPAFTSKRQEATKIYTVVKNNGGQSKISYDRFMREYPDGNNILYRDIKSLPSLNIDTIESVLE